MTLRILGHNNKSKKNKYFKLLREHINQLINDIQSSEHLSIDTSIYNARPELKYVLDYKNNC